MKLGSWKELLFEVFFFLLISLWLDFVFVIATLEIFLPNHTWNIILVPNLILLSSKLRLTKPWFHGYIALVDDLVEWQNFQSSLLFSFLFYFFKLLHLKQSIFYQLLCIIFLCLVFALCSYGSLHFGRFTGAFWCYFKISCYLLLSVILCY